MPAGTDVQAGTETKDLSESLHLYHSENSEELGGQICESEILDDVFSMHQLILSGIWWWGCGTGTICHVLVNSFYFLSCKFTYITSTSALSLNNE
jgi:hypothetical protein